MNTKKFLYTICPFAAIIGLAFVLYANTLHGPFQYDDHFFIKGNQHIRNLFDIGAIWNAMSQPSRFVTFLTFALNYHFHELDVFGYHFVNVLIHCLTGICVYWFTQQLLKVFLQKQVSSNEKLIALFAALLFIAHPVHTQAISYLSQRFASLATLFYLSTICCYIHARLNQSKKRILFFAIATLLAVLGMFTKEIVITLPFMILFIEFFVLHPNLNPDKKSLSTTHILFILFVLSFIVIIPLAFKGKVSSMLFSERVSESHMGDIYHFHTYQFTQWRVFVRYLSLLFFPVNLIVNYDFPMSKSFLEPKALASLIFLMTLLGTGFQIRKKYPLIALGIFWFFITLSANLVPRRHVIFEHKLYLVSIGPIIAFTITLFKTCKQKNLFITLFLVLLTLFSFLTIQRNRIWNNEIALWEENIKNSSNKLQVINNLGKVYIDAGQVDKALEQFNKALEINPTYPSALNNRGFIYKKRGLFDLAIHDFSKAFHYQPKKAEILVNRGDTYVELKEYDKAIADYNRAIEIKPQYAPSYNARGRLLAEQNNYEPAIKDFIKALELNPHDPSVYNNLGLSYKLTNQLDEALHYLNKAIEFEPDEPDYIINRANVYEKQNKFDLALADYNRVIKLDSKYVKGYNNRAVLFGKRGMFNEALADLLKVVDLAPNYPEARSNLGLVYKNLKQYDKAIKHLDKAIELSPDYASAYYNRAISYKAKLNNTKAYADFLKAQELGRAVPEEVLDSVKPKL